MSQLYLRAPLVGASWKLNVTSFNTTLFSQISSVQTRIMQQHFPVKAQQPAVEFQVVFGSEKDFESFWKFVRSHHQAALADFSKRPEVTLWWPEREIKNWTGFITEFRAGGARRNPAPHARLSVDLVDSMFSVRTDLASSVPNWIQVAGYGSPDGMFSLPSLIGEGIADILGMAEDVASYVFSGGSS